jgi:hypothetical protein
MSLLSPVAFTEITESHLLRLIDQGVTEAMDIEFKQALYGRSDADRREFLKDVTAMANTAGGHIIIGVQATDGVATKLAPITTPPADSEKQRLENMLMSVEPRLVGAQMTHLPVADGYVLVLRVPRSWNPPHRVTLSGANRYYLRNSSGVYEPSVEQLRAVFLGSADAEKRLLDFRIERLGRLRVGDRGYRLEGRGQLVVHVLPLTADASRFDLPPIRSAIDDFMPPRVRKSLSYRINFDGLLIYEVPLTGDNAVSSYTQVFRDGRIEMACAGYVVDRSEKGLSRWLVPASAFVSDLASAVQRSVDGALEFGAVGPFAILISFLDAKDSVLTPLTFGFDVGDPLDRADILFPAIIVQGDEQDRTAPLAPIFDAFWNAYGEEKCHPARDNDGNWVGLTKFRR